jgi:hypothetical protein
MTELCYWQEKLIILWSCVTVDLSYQYMLDRGYDVQMTFRDFLIQSSNDCVSLNLFVAFQHLHGKEVQ